MDHKEDTSKTAVVGNDIFAQVYLAAEDGDLKLVETLTSTQSGVYRDLMLAMAVMGAVNGIDAITNHLQDDANPKKDGGAVPVPNNTTWTKEEAAAADQLRTRQKDVRNWALINGAAPLWAIQQEVRGQSIRVFKYSKNISMIRGPGDVPKGTFKQQPAS